MAQRKTKSGGTEPNLTRFFLAMMVVSVIAELVSAALHGSST